jgi:hypothetical protein
MAASLLGTTGNWGIPLDEAGLLITDLSFDFSNQEKTVLDKGGEIIGLSLYQEMAEVKISGLVSKDSPFSGEGRSGPHAGQHRARPPQRQRRHHNHQSDFPQPEQRGF